ncbi:MAG: hypothetical protein AAF078_14060, partial [Planctomycetota bacterium]
MLRGPFWRSCRVWWRFRGLLWQVAWGSVVSAASFGAGIGMLLPVLRSLSEPEKRLSDDLVDEADKLVSPGDGEEP